jgi:hypothetical protein
MLLFKEVSFMKMDEFKKSILKLTINHLRIIVENIESDMEEIRDAKERGYCYDMIIPQIYNLGKCAGEVEIFNLPEWCRHYKSFNLFLEYKYRVIDKIRDFYYHEL